MHLEINEDNMLTIRNMPWLDLGELPVSYNTHKTEAFQVYLVPQDELPINIVIPYDNMKRGFSNNKVFKVYSKCNLKEKNIPIEEITDTLKRASELIEPYRGFLAKRNFYIKLALGISGAVFLILAVMTGMLD